MVLVLLALVASGILCRAIAAKQNLDKVFWFVMGVTFGPLALPFVVFTKIKRV